MTQSNMKEAQQSILGDSDRAAQFRVKMGFVQVEGGQVPSTLENGTPDQGLFMHCYLLCCRLPAPSQERKRSKSENRGVTWSSQSVGSRAWSLCLSSQHPLWVW